MSGEIPYTDVIDWFNNRLLSDENQLRTHLDSARIDKLLHFRIPKMQRQQFHLPGQYEKDMWFMWIVGTWDMHYIKNAQLYKGEYHYRLDWLEEEENCYYDENVDMLKTNNEPTWVENEGAVYMPINSIDDNLQRNKT